MPVADFNLMHIGLNEMYMLHAMCAEHINAIAPQMNDPMREVISRLNPAPAEVSSFLPSFVYSCFVLSLFAEFFMNIL
jgi:hypothetical protein